MKTASAALQSYLQSGQDYIMADLWTFTLTNGTVLYYSSADISITLSGNTYNAKDVLCEGAPVDQSTGLETGSTSVDCMPNYGSTPSTVAGIPFLQAAREGMFDLATIQKDRLFMTAWGNLSLGTVNVFLGQITDVTVTRNMATFKCKDARNLLNIYMPRRQYQPTCPWVFGDSNCGVNRSALSVSSIVATGSSGSTIVCGLSQAAGYFTAGIVKWTSGLNAGISRMVKSYSTGQIQLVAPPPNALTVGDAFTITPGCTKNFAGQVNQFNGVVTGVNGNQTIYTGMTNASGYFNGGTLQFTSGANVGQVRNIANWANGVATLTAPMPNNPAIGDAMVLTSTSSNTQATCTSYWGSNAKLHFGGQRFVPVPETAY